MSLDELFFDRLALYSSSGFDDNGVGGGHETPQGWR